MLILSLLCILSLPGVLAIFACIRAAQLTHWRQAEGLEPMDGDEEVRQ
jgi:hypothetical protein